MNQIPQELSTPTAGEIRQRGRGERRQVSDICVNRQVLVTDSVESVEGGAVH